MKTIIRSYALGLLTAVIAVGIVYFQDENTAADHTEKQNITLDEAKNFVTLKGYQVIPTEDWKELNDIKESYEQLIEEQNEAKPETEEEPISYHSYLLTIEPGMNSSDVSELLYQAQIIDNEKRFNQYLVENGLSTRIQIGEYELISDMTYEEIAAIITR